MEKKIYTTQQEVLGKIHPALVFLNEFKISIHKDIQEDLFNLIREAKNNGFDLVPISGHRDYERQRTIWNEKSLGNRAVLDDLSQEINVHELSDKQKLKSLLRFSAIPGFSRHHWGTDLDVIDSASLADDYSLKLIPQECEQGGPFCDFHTWLTQQVLNKKSFNFYRPYKIDKGFISPEPWHISHRIISEDFQNQLTLDFFIDTIKNSDIELKEEILKDAKNIFNNYVINFDPY